jgi:mono/diheme cytochrome c family protein
MKRFLKVLGLVLIGLLALVVSAAAFVYWKSDNVLSRRYDVVVAPGLVPSDADAIIRGRHLATTRGCFECHGVDLGGTKVVDDSAMGRLHGNNLTRGKGGLPATFGDADWERAIRHGVGHDGRGLFLMPSLDFVRFTKQDMGDLIAYLKSVPPVDRDTVPITLGPVARALVAGGKIQIAAAQIEHATVKPADVTPGVTVEYGQYLAASCIGCHGPNLSGGKIDIGPPDWPHASNLTPHAKGRLAQWTEADFFTSLRNGRRPDGSEINPIMPRSFGQFSDAEIGALWKYLQTLPATDTGVR